MIWYARVAPVIVPRRLLQGRTNSVDRFHGCWVANAVHLRSDTNDWSYVLTVDNVSNELPRLNILEQNLKVGLEHAYHDGRVGPHPIVQICPRILSSDTTNVNISRTLAQARLDSF